MSAPADRALQTNAPPNRLGSTLFVAALAHGVVILGVTFTSAVSNPDQDTPSIKVTLLTDAAHRQRAPEDAEFLANRDQLGGASESDDPQPLTAAASEQMLTVDGTEFGADLRDGVPRELGPEPEQLLARDNAERRVAVDPTATKESSDVPMRAAALLETQSTQTLAAEIAPEAALPSNAGPSIAPSPTTRASVLAAYLDAWRRRVERVGTANFPTEFLTGGSDGQRPTLAVTIAADGRLEEVVIQTSSGDRSLDQAALTILRMAGPFDPLPQELRADFDRLRFAYEWAFIDGARHSNE